MIEPQAPSRRGRFGQRRRVALFLAICVVVLASTGAYVAAKARNARQPIARTEPIASAGSLDAVLSRPHLLFVDTPDLVQLHLAAVPLDAPDSPRFVTTTTCDRVYFAGGRGLCLGSNAFYYGNRGAQSFDAKLQPTHSYDDVKGISSRARVSSDGHFGSLTVFVSGDSYGAPFSTRTHILDLSAGAELGTLEDFTVYKGGAVFQSPDFNFWGTTFAADGNTFYATLGTGGAGGTTYLVKGDLAKRQLQVLRENVECPSLSPDGKRIAFKKRMGGVDNWRLSVLNLSTLHDTELNETRSVDDQVEWLDNGHVLYGLERQLPESRVTMDIWAAATDGSEQPRVFLQNALSPTVVR